MSPEQSALDWLLSAQSPEGDIAIFKQLSKRVKNYGEFVGSYPEVTGYCIPTLIAYDKIDEAERAAEWLVDQQGASGEFMSNNSLVEEDRKGTSVFNSLQIAVGLEEFPDTIQYGHAAYNWIAKAQNEDGSFDPGNTVVAYNLQYAHADTQARFKKWLRMKLRPNGWFDRTEQYSHLLAYTYIGALQLGMVDEVMEAACHLRKLVRSVGLPGFIYSDWTGSHEWTCVTGNAQFAELFYTLAKITGNGDYANLGYILLQAVEAVQMEDGGFPGSNPVYAPYCPYEAPTWAAKFYLDAKQAERGIWD